MVETFSHVFGIVKHTAKSAYKDDLMGEAAGVAYHFLFSILPLLIFLTALSGQVSRVIGTNDVMRRITDFLFDNLAYEQAVAIREPIEQVVDQNAGRLLSAGAILALWGGKNGIVALMKGLNAAYDVKETRSWPRRMVIALVLTLALAIPVLLVSAAALVRGVIQHWLGDSLGTGNTWTTMWGIARWPLLALVLFVGLSVLYCYGPNINMATWTVFPGAAMAVVLWGASTVALSLYFEYLGSYASAYGLLGALLALVFWMYIVSAIILLGGELNSSLYEYLEERKKAAANSLSFPARLQPLPPDTSPVPSPSQRRKWPVSAG
jgi:membrane protein